MKKIMMAVAAVAIATVAQAASVNWTASGITNIDTGAAASLLVYCFNSTDYSYTDAKAALASGSLDFLSSALNTTDIKSGATGKLSASGVGTVENGTGMTGYMVILNASTSAADATKAFITTELTGTASGSTGTPGKMAFGKITGMDSASNWSAVNVPEPTSGLLLLLGMAGLALRRKQA